MRCKISSVSKRHLSQMTGLVFTLMTLAGCSSKMMPAPVMFEDGDIDPFRHVQADDRSSLQDVFYVTNRKPSPKKSLSGDRGYYTDSRSHVLRAGRAIVQLGPDDMKWEDLCKQSMEPNRDLPMQVKSLEEFGVLWTSVPPPKLNFDPDYVTTASREPAKKFAEAINAKLGRSGNSIFIWVHGFNTSFKGNLEQIAEFWHFAGTEGAFISYAWPSEFNLFDYDPDKAHALFSIRGFRLLLEFLAKYTDAHDINILAHSAGSPIVVETLRQMRLKFDELDSAVVKKKTKIGRVILAAPDMDLDAFINCSLDGWYQVAEEVNIYMSPEDLALDISEEHFEGERLGSIEEIEAEDIPALRRETVWTIDVSAANPSFVGHGYYRNLPWVSADILMALKFGLNPEKRGLVRPKGHPFWQFPKDYAKRVKQISKKIYGKLRIE